MELFFIFLLWFLGIYPMIICGTARCPNYNRLGFLAAILLWPLVVAYLICLFIITSIFVARKGK